MRITPLLLSLTLLSALNSYCHAFQPHRDLRRANIARETTTALDYAHLRDADMMELMVGGERYEMVPLPDSMMDTTLFVGNLDEFCKDEDLSNLFQASSTLQSVPACVARKPNMSSLRYGFVTFLTVQEKEDAIMRFHGTNFLGRAIKVEEIRDHPKMGRVKVPERMVSYVVGAAKKSTRVSHKVSSLRSIARLEEKKRKNKQPRRMTTRQRERRRQMEERKKLQSQLEFPLTVAQQDELLRAARRGYLVLEGRGSSRSRKSNSLACAHRQYCDEQRRPQIILCKASGRGGKRSPLDCLIIDLSPLRLGSVVGDAQLDDFTVSWKAQILSAATYAGMELRRDYRQDEDCQRLSIMDEDGNEDMDHGITEHIAKHDASVTSHYTMTMSEDDSWTVAPISTLPVVSMGVFEGDRSRAKAMAKELAALWDIPREPLDDFVDDSESHVDDGEKKQRGGKARRNRRKRQKEHKYINQNIIPSR
mmetsp:Transcript_29458/g.84700  ORF Transcript_29458/g.84700 Transcript_29458/m.84700 type:complete len:478 (-) Transcript_29458:69-1502(-)